MTTPTLTLSPFSKEAKDRMRALRGEPFSLAGWRDAVFLHFAVPAEKLRPWVPFELDLHADSDGKLMAWVSCVAFTMRDLRPRSAPAFLFKPIATHEFLNVRTYVRHNGQRGIYFLAEWLPNLLSVLLVPPVFGLPYRYGKLRYDHAHMHDLCGRVEDHATGAALSYTAHAEAGTTAAKAATGSLEEFLLERYTAFTLWHGIARQFHVWHPPWQATPLTATLHDTRLLHRTGDWFRHATFASAHFTPGFDDIWMGRPRLCPAPDKLMTNH